VANDFETMLREQATPMLGPDEEILAAVMAQPRGTSVARSGVNVGTAGAGQDATGLAAQFERAKAAA
jgi:hypothetical protein